MKKVIYIAIAIIFMNLVISAIAMVYTHKDFYEKLSLFQEKFQQRMMFDNRLNFDYQLVKHNLLSDEGLITFSYLLSEKNQPIEITLSFKIHFLPFMTLVDVKFLNSTFDIFLLNEVIDQHPEVSYRGTYSVGDEIFNGKFFLKNIDELTNEILDDESIGQLSIGTDGIFSFIARLKNFTINIDKYKVTFNDNLVKYSSSSLFNDKLTFNTKECKFYNIENDTALYSFFDINGNISFKDSYTQSNLKQIRVNLYSKQAKIIFFDKIADFFSNFLAIRVDDYDLDALLSNIGLSQKHYSSIEEQHNIHSPKIYFNSLGYDKDNYPFAINGEGICVDCNTKSTKLNYAGKLNISIFPKTLNSYNDKILLYSLKYINLWPCISYIRDKYKANFYLENNEISCRDI